MNDELFGSPGAKDTDGTRNLVGELVLWGPAIMRYGGYDNLVSRVQRRDGDLLVMSVSDREHRDMPLKPGSVAQDFGDLVVFTTIDGDAMTFRPVLDSDARMFLDGPGTPAEKARYVMDMNP